MRSWTEKSFEDFARYTIGAEKNLNIFSDVMHDDPDRGDTPSWVPRWDAPSPVPNLQVSKFTAACGSEACVGPRQEPGVLQVKGQQVVVVTAKVHRFDSDLDGKAKLALLWEVISWLVKSGLVEMGPESLPLCIHHIKELAWCVIQGKYCPRYETPSGDGADQKVLNDFCAFIANGPLLSVLEHSPGAEETKDCTRLAQVVFGASLEYLSAKTPPAVSAGLSHYYLNRLKSGLQELYPDLFPNRAQVEGLIDRACTSCMSDKDTAVAFDLNFSIWLTPRPIFITDGGAMSLGPPNLEKDDVFCILYGGSMPYVLRPISTPVEYTFLGDCYFHGWMYGETFEKSGYEDKWFRLV